MTWLGNNFFYSLLDILTTARRGDFNELSILLFFKHRTGNEDITWAARTPDSTAICLFVDQFENQGLLDLAKDIADLKTRMH